MCVLSKPGCLGALAGKTALAGFGDLLEFSSVRCVVPGWVESYAGVSGGSPRNIQISSPCDLLRCQRKFPGNQHAKGTDQYRDAFNELVKVIKSEVM